jgi:hypothetical protein
MKSASVALMLVMAGAFPAAAGTSFDFLFSTSSARDDTQYFLGLAVSNYEYPRRVIEPIVPRLAVVEDDLPVVLFLARHSGRSIDFIVGLRSKGLSWSVIFHKAGVPYHVLFTGIDRDPGPPYGKAWGYWKKHGKQRKHKKALTFSDADIVGLVHIQTAHRIAGLSTFELARARSHGRTVFASVADEKGRPWRATPPGHSHSHGRGKGHGKAHPHKTGHGRK